MQQIDADITLKFPFGFDYTIDGGSSWVSIAANTDETISADDLPVDKKISIRSNDAAATTLVGANISKDSVNFEEVNIRNTGTVTDISTFLDGAVCNKVFIQRANNVVNAKYILRSSVTKLVVFDEMPSIVDANDMFRSASFGYIGDLVLGATNIETRSTLMFYESIGDVLSSLIIKGESTGSEGMYKVFYGSNIKAIGNFKVTGNNISSARNGDYMFGNCTVGKFPSCDIESTKSSYFMRNGLVGLNTDYIPSFKLRFKGTTVSNYCLQGLFSSTFNAINFAGLSFDLDKVGSNLLISTDDSAFTAPTKGGYVSNANLFGIGTVVPTGGPISSILEKSEDSKRIYYENVNWFPTCKYLRTETVTDLVGCKNVGFDTMRPVVFQVDGSDIDVFKSPQYSLGHLYETTVDFVTPTDTYTNTSNVSISIQGYTARQEGADIKVYDNNNNVMSTISGVTFNTANFNWLGTKLYITTGGVLDRAGAAGQTITNTITVYETTTGTVLDTYSITNDQDEYIVGAYQAEDSYSLKVAKVKYVDDGGTFVFSSAKVDSYNAAVNNIIDTEPIPTDFDLICQDYIEANEFTLVNSVTGDVVRMVGK